MPGILHFTRGLPASGKTTLAKKWVAGDPGGRARINRDDLRAMMHNGEFLRGTRVNRNDPRVMMHDGVHLRGATEPQIVQVRDAAITTLLKAGIDVFCDDTNLPQHTVRRLLALAAQCGSDHVVHDLTHVSLEECLWRDALRPTPVGEDVIRGMHTRYLRRRPTPLPLPTTKPALLPLRPYTPPPGAPKAVVLDVDGTAALMGDRSPYDESRVIEDLPNWPVIETVRDRYASGHTIIVMSGRTKGCYDATVGWLKLHLGVPFVGPFMRAVGDQRADNRVKAALFNAYVRDTYDVRLVLDDRDQVVEMWRSLGLTVFQVAPGSF
ncbi:hypothetical protein GCM10022252_75640 [Streptosporangium oxazolinicum]|uniref:Polynucleotide kinase PNKP phosphatase domain-containing protein n=1 Tax=Streptosporangium oxazolinicum TaxID=909287 RepID=A0ABP8BLG4_9ACTN